MKFCEKGRESHVAVFSFKRSGHVIFRCDRCMLYPYRGNDNTDTKSAADMVLHLRAHRRSEQLVPLKAMEKLEAYGEKLSARSRP